MKHPEKLTINEYIDLIDEFKKCSLDEYTYEEIEMLD